MYLVLTYGNGQLKCLLPITFSYFHGAAYDREARF